MRAWLGSDRLRSFLSGSRFWKRPFETRRPQVSASLRDISKIFDVPVPWAARQDRSGRSHLAAGGRRAPLCAATEDDPLGGSSSRDPGLRGARRRPVVPRRADRDIRRATRRLPTARRRRDPGRVWRRSASWSTSSSTSSRSSDFTSFPGARSPTCWASVRSWRTTGTGMSRASREGRHRARIGVESTRTPHVYGSISNWVRTARVSVEPLAPVILRCNVYAAPTRDLTHCTTMTHTDHMRTQPSASLSSNPIHTHPAFGGMPSCGSSAA